LREGGEASGVKIQAIEVRRFRSIEKTRLTNCGGLNVLIGKNNAGQSDVLSTIDPMHRHLSGAAIAGQ
jgi:predicted ATP-dependent endonuclease of OLD family